MSDTQRPPLTLTVIRAPMGGFVVVDGSQVDGPLVMSKTTLSEVAHSVADLISQYYQPAAPPLEEGDFEAPRMMREVDPEPPRRGFLARIINGGRQ